MTGTQPDAFAPAGACSPSHTAKPDPSTYAQRAR
jgi:hypothetical protein